MHSPMPKPAHGLQGKYYSSIEQLWILVSDVYSAGTPIRLLFVLFLAFTLT